MSAYARTLSSLQSAMLEAAPEHVLPALDTTRPALPERLNVYIEGYRIRLAQAVLADYPTVAHYLGQQEAEKLARDYAEATPSTSYTLDTYPLGFATYVALHGDACAAAIAALESAIAAVFQLPDSDAFTPPRTLSPETLMYLRLTPRTTSRLLALDYLVEDYLVAVRNGKDPAAPSAAKNFLFLVRHENAVKRHALDPVEYQLLSAICTGRPVGQALETIPEEQAPHMAMHLQAWFARWIAGGFFRKESVNPAR